MIIGVYPCCNGDLMLAVPTNAPGFLREECPHCGVPVWHWMTRIDPKSWTEEDFLTCHDIDHATKAITPKGEALKEDPRRTFIREMLKDHP